MEKHKLDQLFSDKLNDYESNPSPEAWNIIEQALDQKNRKSVWPWIGIAASALLAIVSSWYVLSTNSNENHFDYAYLENQGELVNVPVDILLVPVIIQVPSTFAQPNKSTKINKEQLVKTDNSRELVTEVQQPKVIMSQIKVLEHKLTPIIQEPLPLPIDEVEDIVIASTNDITNNNALNTRQPLTIIYKQGAQVEKSKFTQALNYMEDVRKGDKKLLNFKRIRESIQSKFKTNKETNSK